MTILDVENPPCSLGEAPNRHAPPASLTIADGLVQIRGYQNFTLGPQGPQPDDDALLSRKKHLLETYFSPRTLRGRTVLDLGANAGFFSFWALRGGAASVRAVDMDDDYVRILARAQAAMDLENLHIVPGRASDQHEPADVVLAFAMVHWLYSCSETFGSLDAAIGFLADLAHNLLLIEWVAPEDPAIAAFGHTQFHADCVSAPYTFAAFDAALRARFACVDEIGRVTPTRKLFAAWKTQRSRDLDLACPLSRLYPLQHIISCRRLSPSHWSCVYDLGDRIVKQATGDLAAREAEFLLALNDSHFPRVIDRLQTPDYSVLVEQHISGEPLETARAALLADHDRLLAWTDGCLEILARLRAQDIIHRDILPGNILLRADHPVLLDFGWAESAQRPFIIPRDLGGDYRPRDGSFCDLYSMGRVLQFISGGSLEGFDDVCALMTNPDPALRVMDLDLLASLFHATRRGWR